MVLRDPESVASLAGNNIVQRFSDVLRNMAYDAGWPEEITASLSLVYEDGAVRVSYPEKFTSTVNDLEFGKEGQPPNSVIRSFMLRHQNDASKELAILVAEDIYEHGGIL